MSTLVKIIVEKHRDGYIAYPLGLKGVVVAEGDSYEEVLKEISSAIAFHIETFGKEVIENVEPDTEVYIAETIIAV